VRGQTEMGANRGGEGTTPDEFSSFKGKTRINEVEIGSKCGQ